jgi:hypothetical protein
VRQTDGVGRVSVINIGDPYTHLRTGSWACLHKTKPATSDHQLALRRGMLRFGMPKKVRLCGTLQSTSPLPSERKQFTISQLLEVH